jgi:hypothetical protein
MKVIFSELAAKDVRGLQIACGALAVRPYAYQFADDPPGGWRQKSAFQQIPHPVPG